VGDHTHYFTPAWTTVTTFTYNARPVLAAIGDKSVEEEQPLTFTVSATDEDLPGQALTFSLDEAAKALGMAIDPTTGVFTWTPSETQQGAYQVTFQASDNGSPNLSDSETITITVNETNAAPVLDAIGDKQVDENQPFSFTVTASDRDDSPANNVTLSATGLPAGASFDAATGSFTWTPSETQRGVHQVTFQATDDGSPNLSDSETITITVNPVVQLPGGKGTNIVTVSRKDDNIQVVDNKKNVLLSQPLSSMKELTILGAANKSDSVTIDFAAGGSFELLDGIVIEGGAGPQADTVTLRGTGGDDTFGVGMRWASIGGLGIQVLGAEQLTLAGGDGNDTYQISDLSTKTTISDNKGTELLDFSRAAAGVNVDLSKDLSKRGGKPQRIFAPIGQNNGTPNNNTLGLNGTLEDVIGTPQADRIKGGPSPNRLWGGEGDDTLFGNAGNDALYGGDGNDWLYGDAGNDTLYGESGSNALLGGAGNDVLDADSGVTPGSEGRNLLIGGVGADTLRGGLGEEVLIGGTTGYDNKAVALAAIMQEWTSESDFAGRCTRLTEGVADPGNAKNMIRLTLKTKSNPKGTILDDAVVDQFFGGPGSDWSLPFGNEVPEDG
jgi:Ca2+-binding RTX toxin-like protein